MLGTEEPWGDERSMTSRFLPEYFRVAMPTGLMRDDGNGGEEKGPIINPAARVHEEEGWAGQPHRSQAMAKEPTVQLRVQRTPVC